MASVIPVFYKSGVSLMGVQAVTTLGIEMCARAYQRIGQKEMWVTSVTDGKHKDGSKHYEGLAFDLRTRMLTKEQTLRLAAVMRGILEGEWDVVVEGDHIHVEFDPK